MSATAGLLECRLDTILLQFPLQLEQRFYGSVEIGIDRDPFRALGLWVDCVKTDGDVAIQVHPDGVFISRLWLFCAPVSGRVIGEGTVRKWPGRLDRVGAPVHKQLREISGGLPSHAELGIHGTPSFRWCGCTPAPKLGQISPEAASKCLFRLWLVMNLPP